MLHRPLASLRSFVSAALAGVLATGGLVLTAASPVAAASTVTQTYNYTGSTQTFTVPAGVTSITVTLKGGQGGAGGTDYGVRNFGGYQGVVTGTIDVTPGQVITVAVGSGGGQGNQGGSAPGGTAGNNPLSGYDGSVGGTAGSAGSSGGGGGSGAATVIQIGGVDVVAGGAGGNGGNGQFAAIIGRVAEDHHVARPDTTSTTGRPGYNTAVACGGSCDGGASGAGGGGVQGGDRGDVQYGGASATEWFGFGGAPGSNSTGGFVGLVDSYAYYSNNSANGSVTITYDDGAPGAPRNLSATAQTGSVALDWDVPANEGASPITDYRVEYATGLGGPWTLFADGTSTATDAVVTPLTNGTTYYFRVGAVNTQGNGSTATTSLGTVPSDVPGRPTVTGLVPGGGLIHVDFTAPSSDAPITGYEYRLDGGSWTSGTAAAGRITIAGVTNGRAYDVEIRALNVIGAGLPSTPAQSATPRDVPAAPSGLQGVGSDTTVDVQWLAPTVDNGAAVTGYAVQTFALPGGPWTTAATVTAPDLSAELTGLTNGTTYRIRVGAINAEGTGPWSSTADVTPYTVPDTPTVALAPADGALVVTLTGFDGGADLSLVEYQVDGGAWTSTGSGANPFTISGLVNGTSYDITVRVTNAAGTSPASTPVSGTPAAVPAAPSIAAMALAAGAADIEFTLGADGGSPITNLEYSVDGGDNWVTRSPASTASPLQITGLTGGLTYPIVVRAVNAAGHSAASNISTIRANGVPSAPTVTLTPGDGSLLVSFTTPRNGGSPITGYEYRVDSGSYTSVPSSESPFLLTGLTNGTAYTVDVRAVNAAGNSVAGTGTDTPLTTPSAPSIQGNTQADVGGELDVAFTAPSDDGGSAITNYEYSTDAGATWQPFDPASTTSPLTITTESSDDTTPLTGSQEYPVEIRAVNAAGAGAASDVVALSATITAPGAPTITSVTRRDGAVRVAFTAGSNGGAAVIRYEYRLDSGTWTDTGTLATSFDLSGVSNGAHQIEVRAVNSIGDGASSAAESFSMFTLPTAPSITSITAGDETLSVAFTAPSSNGGSAITNYQYSTDAGLTWRSAATTTSPFSITVESDGSGTIANGTLYAVQLRAVNAAGTGPATASTLVAPRGAPDAPTGASTTPVDGGLRVQFTLGSDGGSPITDIEYQLDGGAWVSAGALSSPITITGLTNGQTYGVRVRVVNAIGNGAATASVNGTPSALPGAPTGVTAAGGPASATADWNAPASNGGAPITSYVIRVFGESAGGTALATCTTATIGDCDVTGLTNGRTVYLEVAAVNATGTGPASSPRQAVTPLAAPQVSIGSVAVAPIELTITAIVDDLGGAAITGYEYQLDGGTWVATGSGASPFTIPSLTQGTTYAVRIRAVSAAGTGPASASVNAVPHTVPGAPVSMAAASAPQSAVLTWQVPASNGGQPVTDYVVQYATNANGPFTTFADGTSTATTATVTGLTNTTAYVFRVAAVNTAGNGPWSSLSGATPLGAPSAPTVGTITPGSSYLSVAFTAPSDNGGSAVTGYQYRLDGGTWTTAAGTTSPIQINGLTNGRSYAVQLRAVNTVGGGAASNTVTATPFGLPAGVIGFRATPGSGNVTLDWDAVSDGGSPISAYNIIRWNTSIAGSILATYTTTNTTYTVPSLGAGTYYFTIEATNAAGTGPRSTPRTTAIVGGTVPSAPTLAVGLVGTTANLSWVAGAAGTSAITGYIAQYSTDGTTWVTAWTGSSASTTTSFTLPTAGASYRIRLAAVSAVGVGSFASEVLPVATIGTTTSITSTSATLVASVDANDTTASVSFEYATSPSLLGTLDAVIVAATPATANGSSATSVSADLTGLTPGTSYVARVVATAGSITVTSSNSTFATDALITTSDVDYEYTASPVVVVSATTPNDLPLSRTYVGIGDTVYPSSSTAPTDVGTYRVTSEPTDPAIGGQEVVDITIDPKPMTVTADAVDRDYDGTDIVELAFTLDGVVGGDDVDADDQHIFGSIATPDVGVDRTVSLDFELPVRYIVGDDAANYDPTFVSGDLEVTIAQVSQVLTITSTAPTAAEVGDTYQVTATSSRGLAPAYGIAAGSSGVCTVSGSTVTMVGAGTCEVEVSQAGNVNVFAATPVTQSFTVTAAQAADPVIDLQLDLEVGTEVSGAPVQVQGTGLKPFSTVIVEMHSDPIVLGTFTTDANGSFSGTVTLPATVPAGSHTIIVSGEAPDGDPIQEQAALFVDWSGSVGFTQPDLGEAGGTPSPSNEYTSVSPVRVLDTRNGAGIKVRGGEVARLDLPNGTVPAQTTALVINLTVTDPEAAGFVSVYPCDANRPWASALNHPEGDTVANLAVASYHAGEGLCLYTLATTHLVVDLAGYYAPGQGDPVSAVTPVRLADTRSTARVEQGTTLAVRVTGDGRAPAGSSAASLHIAVTGPTTNGFLTVYPCGEPLPLASNLNFRPGQTIGNSVLTKLAVDGTVCVYSSADTDVVVDLNGVASSTNTSRFQPLVAGRVLDTRTGGSPVAAGSTTVLDFSEVDAGHSVVLNVAAVDPTGDGYVTVYPCGMDRPLVASVNYMSGVTHSNQATVRLGTSGRVCLFTLRQTDVVVDVEGIVLTV